MKKHNYNFPPIPSIPRSPWNRPGLFLVFKKRKQRDKSEFVTKFVGLLVTIIFK